MSSKGSTIDLLALFNNLVSDLAVALAELDDWGLSGGKPGQYKHDLVADDLLIKPLVAEGYRVLTEESGIVEPATAARPITVVIDPIDGSTNASHGLPWFASSLCAVDSEGLACSLVANLASGQRFQAVRGEGVEVDTTAPASNSPGSNSPGSNSTGRGEFAPSPCTELSEAVIGFSGWPPEHSGWRQYRAYGACALDLCAVAGGVVDGFVDVDSAHGVWDYLGAQLICSEAGAPIVDALGRDLLVLDPAQRRAPVAASTPDLLAELLAMREAWPT